MVIPTAHILPAQRLIRIQDRPDDRASPVVGDQAPRVVRIVQRGERVLARLVGRGVVDAEDLVGFGAGRGPGPALLGLLHDVGEELLHRREVGVHAGGVRGVHEVDERVEGRSRRRACSRTR